MIISQVIFSSDIGNKEEMDRIREVKRKQLSIESGPLESKILDIHSDTKAGFTFFAKWEKKEDFNLWMKEIHKDKDDKNHEKSKDLNIEKTLYHFEEIEK